MLEPIQVYSLWGQTFEIAVKRGVLSSLLASSLVKVEYPGLAGWWDLATADVYGALLRELEETDPNQKVRTRETARHLFELGMGLGQTAMREFLRKLSKLRGDPEDYTVRALWCPLQLPRVRGDFEAETQETLTVFWQVFGLDGPMDTKLTAKGFPVRADFLLWLEPKHSKRDRELLCLEFSLNGLPETADYRTPAAHLDELRRYAWYLDSRSVFSRVCAEVSGDGFEFSHRLKKHLPAFTGRDKPLYKLCQAASYVQTTVRWLKSKGYDDKPCNARALSITQNGFESLAATFFKDKDPRIGLLEQLGRAYRETEKVAEGDEAALEDHIRFVFDQIRKALPKPLSRKLAGLRELPQPGESLHFDFDEAIEGFYNPMQKLPWEEAQAQIDSDADLTSYFGRDAKEAVIEALSKRVRPGNAAPLRALHAAAVVAGMRTARPGVLTVLGLEGNPGIGKTTAVVSYLKETPGGFLFFYVSPRVVINDEVTGKLAVDDQTGEPSGILCVTTNSKLIATAKPWYDTQVLEQGAPIRKVDSAVVVAGLTDLIEPHSSTLILSPDQKEALETTHTGQRLRKHAETERQDRIEDRPVHGVLSVLAQTTRSLLTQNSAVNRIVLTAAIQGYREMGKNRTTLDALSKLFRNPVSNVAGVRERREFAERIPTVVVMVDELTGDGAGALFVHSIARWLNQEFLQPFQDEPLFRVILVVADASLGNEIVLDRYLNSGEWAPDKVLVSPSRGKRPFQLAASPVRIGGTTRSVLHVMTNSYPASRLAVDYRVRLDVVRPGVLADGRPQTIRQAIIEQQGQALLDNVIREIERSVSAGADQVICFAQDKTFLRDLERLLTSGEERPALLRHPQVAILDSSVPSSQRKTLLTEDRRDRVKVFLMTSSGARGVSFPKTDWIIALMPRFNIEAALMEVAQLSYRGRGERYTGDDGKQRTDGDWKQRRLVLLLQDFLTAKDKPEPRQWLRQVSDLLTFLVMLRATLHTRITGDAGLERHSLALVPVGGIGSEEMLSLMSTQVREFLSECEVFLRDSHSPKELRSLVASAQCHATHLFAKFSLDATARQSGMKSMVRIEDVERFSACASADNAPLLPDPQAEPDLMLPENLYCVGPFWLEHWNNLDKQERFNIEGWLTDVGSQIQKLYGVLQHIKSDRGLPNKLRSPAAELYQLLAREKEEATREFSTVKALKSPTTWLAVPVDYARFWKPGPDRKPPSLDEEDEAWRDALGRCLGTPRNVLPVIARYAEIPYAVVVGETDPAKLDLIFDDRYLAATHELNLLNSLLLAEDNVAE